MPPARVAFSFAAILCSEQGRFFTLSFLIFYLNIQYKVFKATQAGGDWARLKDYFGKSLFLKMNLLNLRRSIVMSQNKIRKIRYSFALLALCGVVFLSFPANLFSQIESVKAETADLQPPNESVKTAFEENRGQFDKRVRYAARTAGSMIFLTADEAVYVLPLKKGQESESDESFKKDEVQKAFALRMKFVGANTQSTFAGEEIREQRTNYFKGDAENWRADIPNFGAVRYENVYDRIGMIWRGQENGAARYDFTVAPQADADQITLSFEGADNLEVDADGNLLIYTPAGVIKQNKPFSFQESGGIRQEIESGFRIENNRVKFALGEYDRAKPLTIDPTVTLNNLAYSTFLGGLGDDQANAVTVDASGSAIVAGQTFSVNFPTTAGVFDTSQNGTTDIFVSKLNASGSGLMYSTFIGGFFADIANGVAVDSTGAIYVAGSTVSSDFPTVAGSFDTSFNGGVGGDAFVLKLNPTGSSLVYSTYIGGSGDDIAHGMALDANGNVFIAGETQDAAVDFPTTAGAFDTTNGGAFDAFVAKLNASGTALTYSTFLGGATFDFGFGVAIDAAGNAYVAGETQSADFPTVAGSFDTTHNGSDDAFLTKVNPSGTGLIYSTFLGGSGTDVGRGVAVDSIGNAYVTGQAAATFPSVAGSFDTTQNGGFDAFVTKFNQGGTALVFSTFLGGSGNDFARAITLDANNGVYITGETPDAATDLQTTTGAFDTAQNGLKDAFLSRFDSGGAVLVYSTFLGGAGDDIGNSVAVDATGNAYLAGSSVAASPSLPTTPSAFQQFVGGGTDVFVGKFGDYSISGKVVDISGNPISTVMIALSGQVSANVLTGPDGRFVFLDTIAGEPHSVSASRSGYTINPSLFNIANLNNNRELIFTGAVGSPTGGSGSTLSFENLSYNKAENGGTVTATVKRTGTITDPNPVTVDFTTADGTAIAGQDFAQTSGVLTFNPFETNKTINIPVLNDAALEPSESFSIVLSNPTNHSDIDPARGTTQVKILDEDLSNGSLILSEFRERGRLGANDEYVKIFNPNDFDVTIQTADGSDGLTLARSNGAELTPVVTIPNLVTIAARGHYLLTNNNPNGGFSLIDYPTGSGSTTAVGDQTFSADIPDNSNLVLLRTANPKNFVQSNLLDAVGFGNSGWNEGKPLTPLAPENSEMSFVRKIAADGLADTNNNSADFLLVDNHARTFAGSDETKIYSTLGAPAPETSESLRPMTENQISIEDFGTENYDSAPVPNGAQGTLTIYRKITNLTNQPILALRLRAADFPTFGSLTQRRFSSRPDFRLLSSADEGDSIKGVTLAAERLQPNGGGLNSTLTVDAVTSNTPLLPNQSVVIAIRFGAMRYGRHPLLLAVEAMR
jgi:hypothetical protein